MHSDETVARAAQLAMKNMCSLRSLLLSVLNSLQVDEDAEQHVLNSLKKQQVFWSYSSHCFSVTGIIN